MTEIKIRDKEFRKMIAAEDIQQRVKSIAANINEDYKDKIPLFIGVLNGAFIFMADLFKHITIPCELSFTRLSSYTGTTGGAMKKLIGISEDIKQRHLIIVEDIVDTGDTVKYIFDELKKHDTASVKLAAMLFKPAALRHDIKPDYTGFEIPPAFVVGYGLDYDGMGRNLNDIYVLK